MLLHNVRTLADMQSNRTRKEADYIRLVRRWKGSMTPPGPQPTWGDGAAKGNMVTRSAAKGYLSQARPDPQSN
jgi:hypothetical protein